MHALSEDRPNSRKVFMWGDINGRFTGPLEGLDALGRVLDTKVGRYGALNLPFLIVVFDRINRFGFLAEDLPDDVAEALFGREFRAERVVSGRTVEINAHARDFRLDGPSRRTSEHSGQRRDGLPAL